MYSVKKVFSEGYTLRHSASLILYFLIASTVIFAQDNVFPIVEPDDIFYDPTTSITKIPLAYSNNEHRVLFYFDSELNNWSSYPYPTELDVIGDGSGNTLLHGRRSDGTYLIHPDGFKNFSRSNPENVWIFDPNTGRFSRTEYACGWVRSLPNEGYWVIEEIAGVYRLCHTETRQTSSPIPYIDDDGYCPYQLRKPIKLSPNQDHALLLCGGLAFTAYSYDIQQDSFVTLGKSRSSNNENVEIIRWFDDTKAIIRSYPSWNPPANNYYVLDVSKSNSLKFVHSDLYAAPFYLDHPPRLEWMPCEFQRCGASDEGGELQVYDATGRIVEGGLHQYDFVEDQLHVFPQVEGISGISFVIPDGTGDRLYRSLNYTDEHHSAPSTTLIRFNYDTGKRQELFVGEIEWIDEFSPDGRYVVLHMGHDNHVVSNLLLAENQVGYSPDGNAEIAVFDLWTNTIVYEATGGEWQSYGYNPFNLFTQGYNPMPFRWIDSNTLFIQGVLETSRDQIVHLGNEIQIVDLYSATINPLSPDKTHLLIVNDEGGISIYDVASETTIPFIQSDAFEEYGFRITWHDKSSLELSISNKANEDNPQLLAKWLVRVR